MGTWKLKQALLLALTLLLVVTSIPCGIVAYRVLMQQRAIGQAQRAHTATLAAQKQANAPTPFMHRPYYGNRSISSRTVSFVDHDRPWYDYDGIFVRYDGKKWTGVSIGSCTGGINCYDGHNGYDLNLVFEPVLSAAAGTVIRAGWYDPLNHQSALGLWAAVDHDNGYVTAYGHLSDLTVAVGDKVGTQWQLGTSGTTGSSTGPHLHMATYYLPNWNATDPFGWTGSYADPNTVPDNYLWVANPGTDGSVPLLSSNGSAVYPGATLVDDGTAGWSSTGTWNTATSSTDIKGNLHWTTTTGGSATATATWQPKLSARGYYEVGVFVNDNHASSSWVPYTVYSDDPNAPGTEIQHTVNVDESHIGTFQGPYGWENTGPQWVSLGTYYFSTAMNGRVVLSNATGENGAQLSADGVEFAPVTSIPTQAPPTYGFLLTSDGTPGAMLPASTTAVNMTLKNTSNFTWPATGNATVQLTYRWLDAQNHVVLSGNPVALPQNVNPNSSTSLSVPVKTPPVPVGVYTLQWDMMQGSTVFSQQGVKTRNDSVEIARYAESIASTALPTTLPPGASVNISVSAQNRGALPWLASGSDAVTLGYTWLDSTGQPISPAVAGPAGVGTLPADVAPGSSTHVPLTLHTPALAGTYKLVYDFRQQGTTFSIQGATPLTLTVIITPNLPKTYYFAEGYTGTGTTESLSLTNPSATAATITVTYLFQQGAPLTRTYTMPAQRESVLNINQEVGASQTVGMVVQGSQPFVAERAMLTQKGSLVASSDSVGSSSLSVNWYFADGHTNSGWDTLLSVLNPGTQPVTLNVSYLLTSRTYTGSGNSYSIPARSRKTLVVNAVLTNAQFGMVIHASGPLAIEEPMYLTTGNQRGGSSVFGATSAQKSWYFGAGNTSPGFSEHLILANPGTQQASVTIRYLLTNGQVITRNASVPALQRVDINASNAVPSSLHSTVITSNTAILAEREDYFTANIAGAGNVTGSTAEMGSSSARTGWYIAQGDTTAGHAESLALANPTASGAQIQIVYYLSSGAPIVKTYTLPATTRMTLDLATEAGANQTPGIAIYATQPIVVEQDMFFNLNGASGGYTSPGYGV